MNRPLVSLLIVGLCIARPLAATAATVRTATETFVTNRIAAAVAPLAASSNVYTKAETDERIVDLAPAPGDYENISNRVMQTISLPGDDGHSPKVYMPMFKGRAELASAALELANSGGTATNGGVGLTTRSQEVDEGLFMFGYWPYLIDAEGARHWMASEDYVVSATNAVLSSALDGSQAALAQFAVAATNYTDEAMAEAVNQSVDHTDYIVDQIHAALDERPTHSAVTNIVRELSLGGIWDAELEVWWTPVMSNGSLTYQATTNVNLNAEN